MRWLIALLLGAAPLFGGDADPRRIELEEGWDWKAEGLVVTPESVAIMGHRLEVDEHGREFLGASAILQVRGDARALTTFESKTIPLAFSPDRTRLVAMQIDPSAGRCEGCPLATVLIDPSGAVVWRSEYGTRVKNRFSPDGRFLYSAEHDYSYSPDTFGDSVGLLDLSDFSERSIELGAFRSAWVLAGGKEFIVEDDHGLRRARLEEDAPATVWSLADPQFGQTAELPIGDVKERTTFRSTKDGGRLIVSGPRGHAIVVDTGGVVLWRYDWREAAARLPHLPSDRLYFATLRFGPGDRLWLDAQCRHFLIDPDTGEWSEASVDAGWGRYRRPDGNAPSLDGRSLTLHPRSPALAGTSPAPCPRRPMTDETDPLLAAWSEARRTP